MGDTIEEKYIKNSKNNIPPTTRLSSPALNTQLTSDEKTWGMLCHISIFAGYLIPFGNIIGPLVIWLIKKKDSAFVDEQGKNVLNFQISILIYVIISLILSIIVIGVFLIIGILIMDIICTIIAAIRANEGIVYKYPLTIRFIK